MASEIRKNIVSLQHPIYEGLITPDQLGLKAGGSVVSRILHGGRQEGVLELVIDSGDLKFSILPTRGMGIWWAQYKGKDLFWKSPVTEAVHPMYVNLQANDGLGWLDGFCEGVVRCGLAWNGAPGKDKVVDERGDTVEITLPLHGRVGNIPASEVYVESFEKDGQTRLSVVGILYEQTAQFDKYRLVSRTSIAIGGNEIELCDEVTNLSSERKAPLELLYHINAGPPAVSANGRMVFSGKVEPRDDYAPDDLNSQSAFIKPQPGFTEQCYFIDLKASDDSQTGTMAVSGAGDFAVYEKHFKNQLKCFTQWRGMGSDEYVTGLEPGTSLSNSRGQERQAGRLEFLEPGETRKFDLSIGATDCPEAIERLIDVMER